MPLIRRLSGRRSVAGKLREIKRSRAAHDPASHWDIFVLNILEFWLTGTTNTVPTYAIQQIDVPRIEATLEARGSTPYDKAIPWLWREWLARLRGSPRDADFPRDAAFANMVTTAFRNSAMRDWYLEVRPNLAPMSIRDAEIAAGLWHRQVAAEARVSGSALRASHREPFTIVQRFKDGHFITRYDVPEGASHRHLQALGTLLGHCYAYPRTAATYGEDYDLWTLFDKNWVPQWTLATTSRGDRADPRDMAMFIEVKGAGNMPVRPEHFEFLQAFLLTPAAWRVGGPGQADYDNAKGLYKYAVPGSVEVQTDENREGIRFRGKDGRSYTALRWEGHELFDLHLLCSVPGRGDGFYTLMEDGSWRGWQTVRGKDLPQEDFGGTLLLLLETAQEGHKPC